MTPRIPRKFIPLLSTVFVCALLYLIASFKYDNFARPQVFVNVIRDSSVAGIIAVGMTFVILSGGIDLSVGSVMALSNVVLAVLVHEDAGVHPVLAMAIVLVIGTSLGFVTGCIVRFYGLPPFIVTLAGMFFARGAALLVRNQSIGISEEFLRSLSMWNVDLGFARVTLHPMIFLTVLIVGILVSAYTVFGRNVYAVGGNEEAARLMGIPVGRTKVMVYALSGFCASLAGVVFALETGSGNPAEGVGMELNAIAAVVVGGTLLTGGVGYVFGTFIGVLIFGIIKMAILFDGRLSSSWTIIAVGSLLLIFIVLQKFLARPAQKGAQA